MEPKLKKSLDEAINAAIEWHQKAGVRPPETGVVTTHIETDTLTSSLVRFVRRRLWKQALWSKAQTQLANDALGQIFARKMKAARPVDEKQYAFPGFDLPETIRMGKSPVKLMETRMSKFLVFVEDFQARNQRDQKKAEELRRLAEKLRPFADGDPTVGEAFKRANSQQPALALVPRVG